MTHSAATGESVHVLVDALALKPELGGIATYVRSVVRELSRRGDIRLTVVTSMPGDFGALEGVDVIEAPESVRSYRSRVIWRERRLPRIIRERRPAVVFSPTIELPLRKLDVPTLMVVHDLGPAQSPAMYGWGRWLRYHSLLRHSLAAASRVVCVSAATEIQLASSIRMDMSKVIVVGEAGGSVHIARETRAPAATGHPFVLHVGALLPHKNFETLMRAFADKSLSQLELVAVGPVDAGERDRLHALADELGFRDRFHHLGFVERSELEALYRAASCVAIPTINEGFGLPLLEAQVRRAPVVASSIPSLREVAEADSALWVDRPLDPGAWSRAILELTSDERLRQSLVDAGTASASAHSWESVANDLAAELTALADATA
ncbi:MAG: glycosyltransferase family 4 protein [Thermoleophilaceae bacterium]|nr:glycosyltransferase family 4 protein [Thermoleophilaceae bacterium]